MSSEAKDDLIFKALADSRRRKILDLLKDHPRTTGELCKYFKKIDRCTVMQHLGVLEKADLVLVIRKGRFRWNHLNALPIKQIYDRWINPYASATVTLMARIKHDLETKD